jgi:hypothetical protein
MSSPLPLEYERHPPPPAAPISSPLILTARIAAAILALAGLLSVCSTIIAGPHGLSAGTFVVFLGLQVATTVLFAFIAGYRPGPAHTATFAVIALTAAAIEAVTQLTLLALTDAAPRPLTAVRVAVLALSLIGAVTFGLVRNRPALQAIVLQLAHRTLALTLWLLIARGVIALWGRPLAGTAHLLPAAFAFTVIAALAALTVLYTSRRDSDVAPFTESRHLTKVSAILLALAFVCLLVSTVAPTT